MNWVTIIWSLAAGACLTLAVTHLMIWLHGRVRHEHLAFALAALGTAGVVACEMLLMSASDPRSFGKVIQWGHLPILLMLLGLVCFVKFCFKTGRPWLFWLAVGSRLLVALVNFLQPVNIIFREISALREIRFLGQQVSIIAEAVTNPWSRLAALSNLLLLIFFLDASLTLWRKGDADSRNRALCMGGSLLLFMILAAGNAFLLNEQAVQAPYLVTFPFLGILLAMAWQLGSDVTAAARLSTELLEVQEQITLATTAAKLALWSWDIPGDLIWATPESRGMYGFTLNESVGIERFFSVVHPEDRASSRSDIASALSGSGGFASDYRVVLPDGGIRYISAMGKVEFDPQGVPLRLAGVSRDATALRQAEERSKLVVEASPNALIMVDSAAMMVLVNTRAESVFGYSRGELLGKPIDLLIPGRFKAGHAALHQNFLANPSVRAMGPGRELFGRRKDGTEVPLEVGLSPIHTPEGQFVLASILDITGRRSAELEAHQQRTELAHLSRVSSLGQLSGSLAHELNQPLAIILSNAQAAQRMLTRASPDLVEVSEILTDIVDEDRRAGEVIKRLQALLKRGETRLVPVSLNEIVGVVLRLLRSDLIERNVLVRTSLADGLPEIPGDQVQLQQVLLNLISNACDAMAEYPPQERVIRITTGQHGRGVRVSLQDQGCGLPDGDGSRIFDSFYTTKAHGMGIGLSVCRSIVSAHHGRLWAVPNEGRGCTFHLELQIIEPQAP